MLLESPPVPCTAGEAFCLETSSIPPSCPDTPPALGEHGQNFGYQIWIQITGFQIRTPDNTLLEGRQRRAEHLIPRNLPGQTFHSQVLRNALSEVSKYEN